MKGVQKNGEMDEEELDDAVSPFNFCYILDRRI